MLCLSGKNFLTPQQLSSALSSACEFKNLKVIFPNSVDPDQCSSRHSLISVHTVCLYAKIDVKSLQEYSAGDINRRHFQMQVFFVF